MFRLVERIGAYYLVPIAVASPISVLSNYLWADTPVYRGQALSLLIAFTGTFLGLVLWVAYRNYPPRSKLLVIFMLGNLVAWLVIAIQVRIDNFPFNYTTWLAPLVFLLVLLKPSDLRRTLSAADVFVISLLAISLISHLLHISEIYRFPHAFPSRLPTTLEIVGLENRWEGPFASTSDAGPVGAFILMFGLFRHGWRRWLFSSGGALIVVAATSWSSIGGVLVGLIVSLWFVPNLWSLNLSLPMRAITTTFALSTAAVTLAFMDPTFNGRVGIWLDYLSAWLRFPWTGLGTNGILENMMWFTHEHAHNYYIDILTRHGLTGFIATVPLIAFTGFLTFRAGKLGARGLPGVFACWATVLVGETLIDWRYLGYVLMELTLIGLIAVAYLVADEEGERTNTLRKVMTGKGEI